MYVCLGYPEFNFENVCSHSIEYMEAGFFYYAVRVNAYNVLFMLSDCKMLVDLFYQITDRPSQKMKLKCSLSSTILHFFCSWAAPTCYGLGYQYQPICSGVFYPVSD